MSDDLKHYGTPRHSGRYPWGSGDEPYQRNASFLGAYHDLKKAGVSQVDIAKGMGMNTSELRKRIALANAEIRNQDAALALKLREKGYSVSAIGRRMGRNESSVRSLLDQSLKVKNDAIAINAGILQAAVDRGEYIDVGKGVEQYLGISSTKLKNAVALLQEKGYQTFYIPVEQLGTGKDTTVKVLAPPGTEWKDIMQAKERITLPVEVYSEDGRTLRKLEPPQSIDPSRVLVRYSEEGGAEKDGVVELRRGVDDISLGNAKYAQVRIAVDGTHYIKGMAVHSDDIPDGYDLVFNTNKHQGTPMIDGKNGVLKPMKNDDPGNPFGASIRLDDQLIRAQRHYISEDGKEHLSALNIVSEEGNWDQWSKNLSSQMLSKQNPTLAKRQLDLARDVARDEFDDIMTMNNPTVRADLLEKFANQCDSDAVRLKAAPLPNQSNKVILPIKSMAENEVYAPSYRDGETVVLIRHPHGGTFEIPTLTVNNSNKEAKSIMANAVDAIGINSKVAERLSGADFDGDTVVVIPVDNVRIKTSAPLEGLKGFDPKERYPYREGMRVMTESEKGLRMGDVSNLITDMTIKGAPSDEIVKAVRHSMVVIDAEKHKLDYKQSEVDNQIGMLKAKYQGRANGGAATLISKAKSVEYIDQRKEQAVSKMTPDERKRWEAGEIIYTPTGKTGSKGHRNKDGTITYTEEVRKEKSTKMFEAQDAYKLASKDGSGGTTRIESVYADYANSMKLLASQCRKEARAVEHIEASPTAKKVYAREREELNSALAIALRNAPIERQAQLLANQQFNIKRKANPHLDAEHLKRLRGQELDDARRRLGAGKTTIQITDRQWEAINAGAIPKTSLKTILANADAKRVRELATPRTQKGLSAGRLSMAKSMLARGYTQADVAAALGVSVSTLNRAL